MGKLNDLEVDETSRYQNRLRKNLGAHLIQKLRKTIHLAEEFKDYIQETNDTRFSSPDAKGSQFSFLEKVSLLNILSSSTNIIAS